MSYLFSFAAVLRPKGLSKLLDPGASDEVAEPVCDLRWGTLEAVMAARRVVLGEAEVELVGKACRVQVRRAEPAEAGTGRILRGFGGERGGGCR